MNIYTKEAAYYFVGVNIALTKAGTQYIKAVKSREKLLIKAAHNLKKGFVFKPTKHLLKFW